MTITALKLKGIHGKLYSGRSEISDGDGLSLRISPKGKITFQIRYRYDGKPVRLSIGSYPSMTLSEARKERDDKFRIINRGKDPRTSIKLKEAEQLSFRQCLDFWYKQYCLKKRERPEEILHRVSSLVDDSWMSIFVDELDTLNWGEFFRSMTAIGLERGVGEGFIHTSIIEVRTMLRFCIRQGVIKGTEFESLRPSDFAKAYEPRDRVLSSQEIGTIWKNREDLTLGERNQIILVLAMVYGCRIGELANSKKRDFDLKNLIWTVPKENTKFKKKQIRRPIPQRLVPFIERAINLYPGVVWMFPSRLGNSPVSVSSLSKIANACHEQLEVDKFVMHNFRHTLSTVTSDLGHPVHVSEKALGHHMKGVLAVYNKSEMLEQLSQLYECWLDYIEQCAK